MPDDSSPRWKVHVEADGVRVIEAPAPPRRVWRRLLPLGLGLVLALLLLRWWLVDTPPGRGGQPVATRRVLVHDAPRPLRRRNDIRVKLREEPAAAAAVDEPVAAVTPPASPLVPTPVSKAAAASEPAAAPTDEAGDAPSGMALFPPPGTNPPKSGIIVPDDFELPPGYVRHHQVTDDGKPLPPILMFHPDAQLFDAQGRPIQLPADGVVPPELAPAGLPIRILEVPDSPVPMIEAPPEGEVTGDESPDDSTP